MSNAQGSQVFDTTYIDNVTKQLDSIDVCSDLQDFINGYLKPMIAPYETIAKQASQAVAAVNKAARIGSCVLSVPSLVVSDITSTTTDY